MDRDAISALTHAGLPFANPLNPADIDAQVAALDLPDGARVLDIGSGHGELLLRVARAHPGVRTVGIEPAREWAQGARNRGVDEVVEAPYADAGLADGAFDLVCCVASSHAIGTWDAALAEMLRVTRPGGAALVGEGFWARTPSPGYLAALGGATEDELPTHEHLLGTARELGWTIEAETVATGDDWAAYEEALLANGDRALERDEDPGLRAWVEAARARWNHPDGRDTLGFALLTLRR